VLLISVMLVSISGLETWQYRAIKAGDKTTDHVAADTMPTAAQRTTDL